MSILKTRTTRLASTVALTLAAGAAAVTPAVAGTSATAARTSASAAQDCRTYSSVEVCGKLKLTKAQQQCVHDYVGKGMTERRAEVECATQPLP